MTDEGMYSPNALQHLSHRQKKHAADATRKRSSKCSESFLSRFLSKDSVESIRESLGEARRIKYSYKYNNKYCAKYLYKKGYNFTLHLFYVTNVIYKVRSIHT